MADQPGAGARAAIKLAEGAGTKEHGEKSGGAHDHTPPDAIATAAIDRMRTSVGGERYPPVLDSPARRTGAGRGTAWKDLSSHRRLGEAISAESQQKREEQCQDHHRRDGEIHLHPWPVDHDTSPGSRREGDSAE